MAANGYFQVVAEDGRMWLKWRARICTVLSDDYRGRKLDRR